MTRDVQQSDFELAQKLIWAGCEDSGIIARLCYRGVDPVQAKELAEGLREGRLVKLKPSCVGSVGRRKCPPQAGPIEMNHTPAKRHRHRRRHWRKMVSNGGKVVWTTIVFISDILFGPFFVIGKVFWIPCLIVGASFLAVVAVFGTSEALDDRKEPTSIERARLERSRSLFYQDVAPVKDDIKTLPRRP